MKHRTVLLCRRKTALSWLVKKRTKCEYSHVAIYIEVNGTPLVLTVYRNSFQMVFLDHWLSEGFEYMSFDISDKVKFMRSALHKCGAKAMTFEKSFFRYAFRSKKRQTDCSIVAKLIGMTEHDSATPENILDYCIASDWLSAS